MLGRTLANRYKIEAELGRGGMGIVYRGLDTRLNRAVAIKVISSANLEEEDRSRLLAEAQASAQLNHPNIVTVYDAIEADNIPFIVMELVEGKTLRSIPPPDIQHSVDYMRQICSALAHAHSKGIIHRDLKPENALLTLNGIVKLMDFGLARTLGGSRITKTGDLVGTFAYMAPELIEGDAPSQQSDLYALGIMLYEFLTGKFPFDEGNLAKLLSQHLRESVRAPQELNPDIPDILNKLVTQLLKKKPQERPESAQAVELILASLQSDRNLTLPTLLDRLGVQSLDELTGARVPKRAEWDKEWRRKSYPRSAVPILEAGEKEQILSNRAKELAKGIQHLRDHRLLLITGMPGIGKSALARTLLEFMPDESPPPFWYDFERQQSSGNSLGVLLDQISGYMEKSLGGNVREEILSFRNSPDHQASAYDVDVLIDSLNQTTPFWLVFDNIETVLSQGGSEFLDEGLEMLFNGLKNNTHNARIIIASLAIPKLHDGEYLLEFGTRPLNLQGLDEKSSIEFLRAYGLQGFPDEALASVGRMVEGHPFALSHMARYIEALGMKSALNNLKGGLDEFSERFQATLQRRLSADEFLVLQSLTILQREISLDGLCAIAQTKPTTIKRLREEGLLDTNDAEKFWLPTIVKNSLQPASPEATQLAHLRAVSFYRDQKVSPSRQSIDDYANILEWHHHAVQAGDAASSYEALFSTGLKEQLMSWNEYSLLAELCEEILSAADLKPKELSNLERIMIQHTLGVSNFLLGRNEKSIVYLKTALNIISTAEHEELRIKLLVDLAESYNANRDFVSATQIYEQSLDPLSKVQNEGLLAKALQVRGIINREQGNMEQAVADLEDSLKLFERVNNQTGIAYVTGELGIVYYYQNRFSKAIENYQRALSLCEARHDLRGAMIGHFNVGDILLQDEQYELAEKELQLAWEIAHKRKLTNAEITTGLYLVEARIALLHLENVEDTLNNLKILITNQDSPCFSGQELALRASLYWKKNQFERAEEYFENAFTLLNNENCQYERARAYLAFAGFLKNRGEVEEAKNILQKGKEIFTTLDNKLGLQNIEKSLNLLH